MPNTRPENMPWVSSYLVVDDVAKSIFFYERAFGFQCRNQFEGPSGQIEHAELEYKDGVIMLGPENEEMETKSASTLGGSPMGLYIYVEDVDEFYQKALNGGAGNISPPENKPYGDRVCQLSDLEGLIWTFATHSPE